MMLSLLATAALGAVPQEPWPGASAVAELHAKHGFAEVEAEWQKITGLFMRSFQVRHVAPAVTRAFAEPFSAPAFASELTERWREQLFAKSPDLEAWLRASAALHGEALGELASLPPAAALEQGSFAERLAAAEAHLARAAEELELALRAIPADERAVLGEQLATLGAGFIEHIYVTLQPQHRETLEKLQPLELAHFYRAALMLLPLCDSRWIGGLEKCWNAEKPPAPKLLPPGVSGRVVYARETPLGWILVGGGASQRYGARAALIVDWGGDDVYEAQATRADASQLLNLVLDLRGKDRYEGGSEPAQGSAVLGVSVLCDFAGDDRYTAGRFAQGAGFGGVGILWDRAGNDRFEADALAQGAGGFGCGLLLDSAGDDQLRAKLDAQGFGWPRGVGLLADALGDDQRVATEGYPSSYGTAGEWNAHSQGAGFGFRTLDGVNPKLGGGYGVLLDGAGDDRSTVGEFGFGIGYFFGWGIVRDFGGDDQVNASRYGIATGAHNGIGIVFDDAGSDRYANPHTASIAGNWDLQLSFFLDAAGDDHYLADGIGLGGSTITSLAVFVDLAGNDVYQLGSDLGFGGCGHASDVERGSRSWAFFLDLGRGTDQYPSSSPLSPAPANDLECLRRREESSGEKRAVSGVGVFLDR
ncbi:MAG: hypothetical protein IPN34_11080 [Planctomycetes bacterium]|nr:hypothetical protein [Planctomycetota bacterium]